ncbi:MAG: NADH-quinone oxidoreductase subunit J [Chlorobiales bacterium]|jgi:NADH-quinone oxidoreductase subunit J|nr:NADH-quinone oxidoreductase subunit J [Chlorobiales bacterium]
MDQLTYQIIFYLFAAITILSAIFVVFSRNIIYSAFSLLFTFFGAAAIYVFLSADFIAVTQIVVYVGGILVLLLFGVMFTNKVSQVKLKTDVLNFGPGLIIMLGILGAILYTFYYRAKWVTVSKSQEISGSVVERIGYETMSNYVLPFEIASIVLLIALIGAAYLARTDNKAMHGGQK